MREPSVGTSRLIVVSSTSSLDHLRRSMDSLLPTVRTTDRVVIATPSHVQVAKTFSGARRVTVVEHPRARLAGLIADLADAHDGPVVVVEDHLLFPDKHWLDRLVAEIGDYDVIAPASNGSPAPQCPVDGPGLVTDRDDLRDVARRCAERPAEVVPSDRLFAPVVVLRPEAARALSSRTVDAHPSTLAAALALSGYRLGFAPHVYVHASRRLPLLSHCMIMKNETEFLASCLGSTEGLTDEVVIYDTGSDDGSVALARCLGASVIEGYWDSNFSRARNASLAWCRGEFVLAADPDDLLDRTATHIGSLRSYVVDHLEIDSIASPTICLSGWRNSYVDSGFSFPGGRLLNRRRTHWVGSLHEQAARRDGSIGKNVLLDEPVFHHRGYLTEVVMERKKTERNLEAIEMDDDVTDDGGRHRFDRARSLSAAGRNEEAMELMRWVVDHGTNEFFIRGALWTWALIHADVEESRHWLERLRACSPLVNIVKLLEAQQLGLEDRHEEGLAVLDGWTLENDRFTAHTREEMLVVKAKLLVKLERYDEATDAALDVLAENPISTEAWRLIGGASNVSDEQIAQIVDSMGSFHVAPACSSLLAMPPSVADRFLDTLALRFPAERVVLAAASEVSLVLPIDRMVVWSERIREHRLHRFCPLLVLGGSVNAPNERRIEALAAAVERFGDRSAARSLEVLQHEGGLDLAPEITDDLRARYPHAFAEVVSK
jgi:glycosyltransferase involved in cell wall biosynthesis